MSIFKESKNYRPFTYPWAVEAARKHTIDMFWDIHQCDLQDDLQQYNGVDGLKSKDFTHQENKDRLNKIMCGFTEMDKTVASGYKKLLQYVNNNEISNLLLVEGAREVTHQRGYALGPETFGIGDACWSEFVEFKEMQNKLDVMADEMRKPNYRDELNAVILLAQILLGEGVGLYAAFSSLLNYKRFGKMMGYNDVNQWSLVDEQEHVVNNIRILLEGRKELCELELAILDHACWAFLERYVEAEKAYISCLGDAQDLTMVELCNYVEYLGEFRAAQLGLISLDEVRDNPLPWMEWMLSASKHDNFFEKRVTAYSHSKLTGTVDYSVYGAYSEEKRMLQQ